MGTVLFWDMVGAPFDGNTPKERAIGGSELAEIQLAEGLALAGVDVHILCAQDPNQAPRTINGVKYGHQDLSKVTTVIAARMTPVPEPLAAGRKVIVSLTDAGPHEIARCHLLVGICHYQLSHFPNRFKGQKTKVIPPIIEHVTLPKVPGRLIYASAPVKGLRATLDQWMAIRDQLPTEAELVVTYAWGEFPEEDIKAAGARFLGMLTPEECRKEIAKARGLFYVNQYPECYSAICSVAEASGTRPIVHCVNNPGGLPESMREPVVKREDMAGLVRRCLTEPYKGNPRNCSQKKIVQAWLNIIE